MIKLLDILSEIKIRPGFKHPKLNQVINDEEFINDLISQMGYEYYHSGDIKNIIYYDTIYNGEPYYLTEDELLELVTFLDKNFDIPEWNGEDDWNNDEDDEELDEIKIISRITPELVLDKVHEADKINKHRSNDLLDLLISYGLDRYDSLLAVQPYYKLTQDTLNKLYKALQKYINDKIT